MTTQEVYENLLRDAVSIYSKEGLKEKLESGRRLKIKLGADPSPVSYTHLTLPTIEPV